MKNYAEYWRLNHFLNITYWIVRLFFFHFLKVFLYFPTYFFIISLGAFAIITIMTGNVVNKFATFSEIPKNDTVTDLTSSSTSFPIIQDDTYTPIQVATIVCFMSGVWSVSKF